MQIPKWRNVLISSTERKKDPLWSPNNLRQYVMFVTKKELFKQDFRIVTDSPASWAWRMSWALGIHRLSFVVAVREQRSFLEVPKEYCGGAASFICGYNSRCAPRTSNGL
jgi:hypothetical protein